MSPLAWLLLGAAIASVVWAIALARVDRDRVAERSWRYRLAGQVQRLEHELEHEHVGRAIDALVGAGTVWEEEGPECHGV